MALVDPIYLDTSALVKLLIEEPETAALSDYIGSSGFQMTTSVVTEVELARAVSRVEESHQKEVASLLNGQVLVPLTDSIRLRAAHLQPFGIPSLDAIHLATAVEIQPSLHAVISYDRRMSEAAGSFGLEVLAPA